MGNVLADWRGPWRTGDSSVGEEAWMGTHTKSEDLCSSYSRWAKTMSTAGKTEPGYRNDPAGGCQPASRPWDNQCSSNRLECRVALIAELEARHRLNIQGRLHHSCRWWMSDLLATETKAIVHPPRLSQIPPVYQPAIWRHLGKSVYFGHVLNQLGAGAVLVGLGIKGRDRGVSIPTHTWWLMWMVHVSLPCNFRLYDLDILVFRAAILSRKPSKNSTNVKLKLSHIIWGSSQQ